MTNIPRSLTGVNRVEPLLWQLDRQDVRELLDYAGRWAWHVYGRIVQATGNEALATQTADKVQAKLLERDGASARWQPRYIDLDEAA